MASEPIPQPMTRGRGSIHFEIFLEATCPYSKRAFGKLTPLLKAVGEDAMTVRIRLLSQPWHLFTPVVTRCILAASATEGGSEAGWHVLHTIFDHREEFITNDAFDGPNMEVTLAETIARISELSGIDLAEPFRYDTVGSAFVWHTRYARQMGAHMTPSVAINGLLENDMHSGQSVEEWIERARRATRFR